MSYSVTISQPALGTVKLDNGLVSVVVDVVGDTPIDSVYAEAYEDGQPQPDPQFVLNQLNLSPDGCSGSFGGDIPGFCDTFDIVAEAYFDNPDPMGQEFNATTSQGPYTGDCSTSPIPNRGAAAKAGASRKHSALVRLCKKLGITKRDYYRWLKPRVGTPPAPTPPAPPPAPTARRRRQG